MKQSRNLGRISLQILSQVFQKRKDMMHCSLHAAVIQNRHILSQHPQPPRPDVLPHSLETMSGNFMVYVMEQLFNNYFLFCPCLLLFGFVDDIIKGQQYESDFISFYLCLSLFGYLLSLISLSSYLWLISYWRISGPYPIG